MNWKQRLDFALPFVAMLLIAALLLLAGCTVEQTDRAREGVTVIRDGAETIGETIPGTTPYTGPVVALSTLALSLLALWREWQEKRRLQRAIKTIDPIIDALPEAKKKELATIQGPKVAAATKRAKLA